MDLNMSKEESLEVGIREDQERLELYKKAIENTEERLKRLQKELEEVQKVSTKTVPLLNGGKCRIFPFDHPLTNHVQIRCSGPYQEKALFLGQGEHRYSLIKDKEALLLLIEKK